MRRNTMESGPSGVFKSTSLDRPAAGGDARTKPGFLLACLAALAAPPLDAQQISSRVIAYSGMPAPGASPALYDTFNYPAIAPQGEIVFRGRLNSAPGTTYGLWRERFDTGTMAPVLSLVQRESQP